jgi:hypothetical protein
MVGFSELGYGTVERRKMIIDRAHDSTSGAFLKSLKDDSGDTIVEVRS